MDAGAWSIFLLLLLLLLGAVALGLALYERARTVSVWRSHPVARPPAWWRPARAPSDDRIAPSVAEARLAPVARLACWDSCSPEQRAFLRAAFADHWTVPGLWLTPDAPALDAAQEEWAAPGAAAWRWGFLYDPPVCATASRGGLHFWRPGAERPEELVVLSLWGAPAAHLPRAERHRALATHLARLGCPLALLVASEPLPDWRPWFEAERVCLELPRAALLRSAPGGDDDGDDPALRLVPVYARASRPAYALAEARLRASGAALLLPAPEALARAIETHRLEVELLARGDGADDEPLALYFWRALPARGADPPLPPGRAAAPPGAARELLAAAWVGAPDAPPPLRAALLLEGARRSLARALRRDRTLRLLALDASSEGARLLLASVRWPARQRQRLFYHLYNWDAAPPAVCPVLVGATR